MSVKKGYTHNVVLENFSMSSTFSIAHISHQQTHTFHHKCNCTLYFPNTLYTFIRLTDCFPFVYIQYNCTNVSEPDDQRNANYLNT